MHSVVKVNKSNHIVVHVGINKGCDIIVNTLSFKKNFDNIDQKTVPVKFGVLMYQPTPGTKPKARDLIPVAYQHFQEDSFLSIEPGLNKNRLRFTKTPVEFRITLPENCELRIQTY